MEIIDVINKFNIDDKVLSFSLLGKGHINFTYLVKCETDVKYVLQKINNVTFKDVDGLMSNLCLVTDFLNKNGFESIRFIKTKDGQNYLKVGEDYFRMYRFIDDVVCYEEVDDLSLVTKAAIAFGRLHKTLDKFDAHQLVEVIPHFHDTYLRYQNLLNAVKNDKFDRVKNCLREIEEIKEFENEYPIIMGGIKDGSISYGVTHNDPKINNVLFDKKTGDIRAVIDLDTVMPGSYLFDFGDALRSLFTRDNEDSELLYLLQVNKPVYRAYVSGYLSEMSNVLTEREKELLPFSAFLMTMECGIRFLEDYLNGDVYFHTSKPNHNLIRARTQITLAKRIHDSLDDLREITKK